MYVCGGVDVGRQDNGEKDEGLNFGYVEIEVHGGFQGHHAGGSWIIRYTSWLVKRVLRESFCGGKRRGSDPWGHSCLSCGQKEQSERKEK